MPPPNFLPVIGQNIKVSKPVIAAVNGGAYAGGWRLVQMCDLCVASESAKFAITEARVGRGVPWAAPLIHMIPQRIMLELLMTANPISAQRAYELGFVNHVVGPGEVMAKARALANDILAGSPLFMRAVKEMVVMSTEVGNSEAVRGADRDFRGGLPQRRRDRGATGVSREAQAGLARPLNLDDFRLKRQDLRLNTRNALSRMILRNGPGGN